MRVIGWIGVLHITVIAVWMIINIVFSLSNPINMNEDNPLAENGIAYYSAFPGYLGMDHGSKSLIMILSIAIPVGLFICFKNIEYFRLRNTIALISGCFGFALYGLSLMLQAVTVEYAFNLFNSSEDMYSRQFATLLYDWSMLQGGLSVSIYIIANLLLAAWIILHSIGLSKFLHKKRVSVFGYFTGGLMIAGYLIAWFFLMQGEQSMHNLNEIVGVLFMLWIFFVSMKMIKGTVST